MDRVFARPHKRANRGAAAPASGRVAHPAPGARVAAVGRMVTGPRVQPKLRIGAPDDSYEQEADRVADRVMRMPDPAVQRMCTDCEEEQLQRQPLEEEEEVLQTKPLVQRICTDCEEEQLQRQPLEEEEEVLQTKPLVQRMCADCEEEAVRAKEAPGSVPEVDPGAVGEIRALSGGRPLPAAERAFFEPRMGADFGDVRVHTGARAEALASGVQARAFTHGRDVVFGRGEYAPGSSGGRQLMAHELTHVLQQQGGQSGPIRRQHVADTGWRYTPPATVTRSIEEIQGVVGTTPDGVYGINTKTAVIRYQKVLRDRGFYAGTIDGKWGGGTDLAHEAFATGPNAERLGYNCAGFAFKRFTWINLVPTRTIYAGMTQLAKCSDRCSPFDHKFWMWEFDLFTKDTRTGHTTATHRDFHTVGGQTDQNGAGPNHVMSKNGGRPVVGPRPGPAWRPAAREPVIQLNGSPHPFKEWHASNFNEGCFCSPTLP